MPVSPLHELHERLGARFTEFGGWTMPLRYAGVVAEHLAVREAVGVFDVSHLGRFVVAGAGSRELLRHQLCNDVAKLAPGRAQYSMALNDAGGVVDDVIVWWIAEDEFWVLPNGTNFGKILDRFTAAAPTGVAVVPRRDETVLLAVQGPEAPKVVEGVVGTAPGRFRVVETTFEGRRCIVAGTGYTGEAGAELAVPREVGAALFSRFVDAGAAPCGLGARDTLRLEMGYPLWGQDLDETTTPLAAGLEWVVAWDHDFVGRRALEAERTAGPPRRLVGFRTEGRRIPRPGHELRGGSSRGRVTSGNFSPVLERGIGMGYLAPPFDGSEVEVRIRDRWVSAEVVTPPFIDR